MSKFYKAIFLTFVMFITFFVFGGKADAATTFTSESHSPTSARTTCNTFVPVDFAAYIDNVSLNTVTGLISYNVRLGWRNCTGNPADTRAYAIWSTSDLCPLSGWYGQFGTVYDCVKYIGNPAYSGSGNGLSCLWGTNSQCVTPAFNGVRVTEQGPSALELAVIPMTYQITNWSNLQNSSGSRTVSSNMCQFYKTQSSPGVFDREWNNRCINMNLTVNWTYTPPNTSWDVGVSATCDAEAGTVTFNVFKTSGTVPGTVNVNMDIWLTFPDDLANAPTSQSFTNASFPVAPIVVNVNPPPSAGQYINASITISPGGSSPGNNTGNDSGNCTPDQAVAKPYLRVYGHDTIVGLPFRDDDGQCTSGKIEESGVKAGIRTSYKSSGGNYFGAGSQFAVSAFGTIDGFISASLHNPSGSGTADSPVGLSFGNYNSGDLAFGSTGGDDAAYTGCMPDFLDFVNYPGSPFIVDSSITNPPGPSLVNISTNPHGFIQYYNEDIVITGNAIVSNTDWNNLGEIQDRGPFGNWGSTNIIVVSGDVYINANVDRFDGIIVAIPDSGGNGGEIDTCVPVSAFTECKNQLIINGAVIAKKVYFNRINGNVGTYPDPNEPINDEIAEVINFKPVDFLTLAFTDTYSTASYKGKYDSVVGLPPIL